MAELNKDKEIINADIIRQDIEETRSCCKICGYQLTYLEFIMNGNYCVFHSKSNARLNYISLWRWVRFAIKEYKVMKAKLRMVRRGQTAQDYFACLGNVSSEIEHIKDAKDMNLLYKKLKQYKLPSLKQEHEQRKKLMGVG